MLNAGGSPRTIYAISELNEILRALVEDSLPSLWIQGEVSNFSKPSSGHWYFTLKDDQAQIRCAMFRKANYYIRPLPQNGDAVLVRAKASVYPGRGELQLVVEHLEPAGTGALLRAFEELKQRLAAEGLFDTARKRLIVQIPRRIGLITSGSGAALHDVLTTLARRWPLAEVLFYPVPVQGIEAASAIVKALNRFSEEGDVDTLLLVRGGGSIEDLSAFNDETVARAIRSCRIPVVAGIGHEVDVTIADFAADLRAATPTAAAELATPDAVERRDYIDIALRTLKKQMARALELADETLQRREVQILRLAPFHRLRVRAQSLDELELRAVRIVSQDLHHNAQRIGEFKERLRHVHSPIFALRREISGLDSRLRVAWFTGVTRNAVRLDHGARILGSFNPRDILKRGYAIVTDTSGTVLFDPEKSYEMQRLNVQFARARLSVEVKQILASDAQTTATSDDKISARS